MPSHPRLKATTGRRAALGTLVGMNSQRVAGWMLVASGVVGFLGQLIAVVMWQGGLYSLQFNLISDLGMTTCAPVDDAFLPRYVCSPGHLWFNLGTIAAGVLLVVGGALLRRLFGCALAVSGVALIVVGAVPVDRVAGVHDAAAIGQAVLTWVAMVLVVIALRETRAGVAVVTGAILLVSLGGFVLLLLNPEGAPGLYERISFDLLSVWVIYLGAVSLGRARTRQQHRERRVDPEKQERDAAIRKAARDLG